MATTTPTCSAAARSAAARSTAARSAAVRSAAARAVAASASRLRPAFTSALRLRLNSATAA
eukprot:scaffold38236_cov24-Phaeocystis_antarctica.AAC.1